MKLERANIIYILILLFVTIVVFGPIRMKITEGFTHYNLQNPGSLPDSETLPIMTSMYPYSGKKNVGNKSSNMLWKQYPITAMSSYKQITNNFRYNTNPDNGTCTPADMCDVLYENIKVPSNVISPLPPTPTPHGTQSRVGYYVASAPSVSV